MPQAQLYVTIGAAALVLAALGFAWWRGRKAERGANAERDVEAAIRIAESGTHVPDSDAALIDRLRNGGGL